jgi:hypothetical protein
MSLKQLWQEEIAIGRAEREQRARLLALDQEVDENDPNIFDPLGEMSGDSQPLSDDESSSDSNEMIAGEASESKSDKGEEADADAEPAADESVETSGELEEGAEELSDDVPLAAILKSNRKKEDARVHAQTEIYPKLNKMISLRDKYMALGFNRTPEQDAKLQDAYHNIDFLSRQLPKEKVMALSDSDDSEHQDVAAADDEDVDAAAAADAKRANIESEIQLMKKDKKSKNLYAPEIAARTKELAKMPVPTAITPVKSDRIPENAPTLVKYSKQADALERMKQEREAKRKR